MSAAKSGGGLQMWRTMGYRGKIVVGTTGLVVGFVLMALAVLSALILEFAAQQTDRDLEAGRRSYGNYMVLKRQSLRDRVAFLSHSPVLRASLESRDAATIGDALVGLKEGSGLAFALACDADGRLLASAGSKVVSSISAAAVPGLQRALGGEVLDTVWRLERELFLVAVAPVTEREGLVAVLIVAERFGQGAALEVSDVTGRDVVVVVGELLVAQAWRHGSRRRPSSAEEQSLVEAVASGPIPPSSGRRLELSVAGAGRAFLAIPLQGDAESGALLLSSGPDEVLGLLDAAWACLLVTGLTVTLLGALLGTHLSSRLARPLRDLIDASDAMARGDLEASVEVRSRDDIGRLGHSFNRMARTIKQLVDRVCDQAARVEAASHAKDSFLASVSHELRTPLTSIKAYAEILLNFGDDSAIEERQEFLTIISAECERLTRLISQVLDFAKIEAGQMAWSREWIDVPELIRTVAQVMAGLAKERDVTFSISGCDEAVLFDGDRDRIQQVLTNLLNNACKFTPEGTQVSVALTRMHDGLEIRVADRGPGIPGDEAKKSIFDEFYQFGDTLTGKPSGTGLGLTISRELVEMHGGSIWCEDHEGGGAVFVVHLPNPGSESRPLDDLAVLTS